MGAVGLTLPGHVHLFDDAQEIADGGIVLGITRVGDDQTLGDFGGFHALCGLRCLTSHQRGRQERADEIG